MIKLLDVYPQPSALIRSETKAAEYLADNPYIKEVHADFARHASECYQRSRNSASGFEFSSHLDIWHTQMGGRPNSARRPANVRLVLGSLVQLRGKRDYANITHCLCVLRLRAGGQYTILRKFHFDVTAGNEEPGGRLQRHPRFHLQYCGELLPYMKQLGVRTTQLKQLHPSLSEPRIFFTPMSLALMLDMTLREFPDPASAKFRATGEWRGIVREHESLVLLPFFEKCVEAIKQTGPTETLADQFYIG
jgi:hypothetical protein